MKKMLIGLLAIASSLFTPVAAYAAPASQLPAMAAVFSPNGAYIPTRMLICAANATAAYTNATTSYTDITAATCSVPATNGDYSKEYIETCWSADVSKATGTTGTIQVYVNGAGVSASRRSTHFSAGANGLSGCYVVARSSAAAQSAKLQGVSADTSIFTVGNAEIRVSLLFGLGTSAN